MSIYSVKFRGEVVDIQITKDGGYEHDTGAHDLDWNFCDAGLNLIEISDDEQQEIFDQLYEGIYERRMCEEPEL